MKNRSRSSKRKSLLWLVLGVVVLGLCWWWLQTRARASWVGPYRFIEVVSVQGKLARAGIWEMLPETEEVRLLVLPENLVLRMMTRPGEYRLAGYFDFSKQETGSTKWFTAAVADSLGLMVAGTIEVDKADALMERGEGVTVGAVMGRMGRLIWQRQMPVVWWWRWWQQYRQCFWQETTRVDLASVPGMLESITELDGQTEERINETVMADWYLRTSLVGWPEQLAPIEAVVVNGTSMNGRANLMAKKLANQGLVVVNMEDAVEKVATTRVRLAVDLAQDKKLTQVFAGWLPGAKIEFGETQDYRAEAVIILGEENW